MEHLDWNLFQKFVHKLAGLEKLTRIVVDEAHLSGLWAGFRPSLQRLGLTMRHIPDNVRRILFSATVPPRDAEDLLVKHGVREAIVYRNSAIRKNISIHVRVCTGALHPHYMEKMIEELHKNLGATVTMNRHRGKGSRVLVYGLCVRHLQEIQAALVDVHRGINPLEIEYLMYYGNLCSEVKKDTTAYSSMFSFSLGSGAHHQSV